ncbi:MAG: 6-phosphogluconolactonase [Desulfobacterales bacterium]|jgi:6-phosphogluconolactonase
MLEKSEVIIVPRGGKLARKGAEIFYQHAKNSISSRGKFSVAVSGGSTPLAMHRLLGEKPFISDVPWHQTHIFWVDERLVSVDDPASNFGAAKSDWLTRVPIPKDQIHPMPVQLKPQDGADNYQAALEAYFTERESNYPVFDLIFLGIGTDGHTASLFPENRVARETKKWVVSVKGGKPDVYRLTLTYAVLNNARCVCFMVSGKKKAPIIHTVFVNPEAQLPAQRIAPTNGALMWLLDEDAAALLPEEYIH